MSQSNIDFVDQLVSDDSDVIFNGIQERLLADNSFDSDDESVDNIVDSDLEDSTPLLDPNMGDSDPDDISLLQLYKDGGITLFSAEDLSDEVDITDLDTSIEIVAEVVHASLDDGFAIPEEEIVAGPSGVSSKRKVENRVFVVPNKKPRTK